MNNYTTIFDKLLDIINYKTLEISAYKLNIDYNIALNHLKALIYFHLAKLDSLRDINDFMQSDSKLKESIKSVSLGTLSNYNNHIDYNVFVPVLNELISNALNQIPISEKIKRFGNVKLIDSSTISMAKTYFEWAEFRSTKAGIKLHTKFDLGKGVPELIVVSNAKSHDRAMIDDLITENNCIYIFDKGYIDYKKFDEFSGKGIQFITRLKDNAAITEESNLKITYSDEMLLDDSINIIEDTICYLGTEGINMTKNKYRIISILDSEGQILTFITNIFEYSSEDISWLYKKRWEIELFFKWIKQNLKIKRLIKHSITRLVDNTTFSWSRWLSG